MMCGGPATIGGGQTSGRVGPGALTAFGARSNPGAQNHGSPSRDRRVPKIGRLIPRDETAELPDFIEFGSSAFLFSLALTWLL